jgi:DNA-binding beta-propeller fold protein YncE
VRRLILVTLSLALFAPRPLHAGTFDKSRIAPDLGVDALTRGVAREQVGRDLFSDPYAAVTIGSVDVYDVFPYVESRTFQIVSDPEWDRLVYGEQNRSLRAYDGKGQSFGPLDEPRGLAVDEDNRLYVADAGNDRVVVLKASTEFGEIRLLPLYEIKGLHQPYDVAYSDGGTPFTAGDDHLYVVDSGRNRVVAYDLAADGARVAASIGELGDGDGRFAGPLAVAVGRSNGASTPDVYVADAHSRRIVHLRHQAGRLEWVGEVRHDADVVTSLETDQWGNVYAAAPNQGVVHKLNPALEPVAELREGLSRPRSFHVPFLNVRDHRDGSVNRVGKPNGLSVEQWTDASGMQLWQLGVEVAGLEMVSGDAPAARFTLTDRADVTVEIVDLATGRSLARRPAGTLGAGIHQIPIADADLRAAAGAGDPVVRLAAVSSYADGSSATAQASLRGGSGAGDTPSHPMLLGSSPNPATASTRIAFVLPAGAADASLDVYDAAGRLVRSLGQRFAAGRNEVMWNGTNADGAAVPAGIYFYKLRAGGQELTRKLVMVR